MATLIKQLKSSRSDALLLDGGDLWQGSATALWTQGQDMVDASKLLGIDVMTGHWEFTLGAERVQAIINNDLAGHTAFLAQNIRDKDFGDPVFPGHVIRELKWCPRRYYWSGLSHTRRSPIRPTLVEGWSFGIRERELQKKIDAVRS